MYPEIEIFGNVFKTYDTCVYLGIAVVFAAVLLFRPKEFPLVSVLWVTLMIFFFAFLGAAVLNIIMNAPAHRGKDINQIFYKGGAAYLGAPILIFLFLWIYSKSAGTPFLKIADFAAPFLMLERAIGRIGCLGYGCCHGIPSKLPWAYPFLGWPPKHPTQAYELIYALAIFVSSRYLYKKLAGARGVTFFYVVLCYSFFRFFNDILRTEGPFIFGNFKFSHIALFIFSVVAAMTLVRLIKKSNAKEQILKALKGAAVRLIIWLFAAGAVILYIISVIHKTRAGLSLPY